MDPATKQAQFQYAVSLLNISLSAIIGARNPRVAIATLMM